MKPRIGLVCLCAVAAMIAAGCGGQRNPLLVPNQPPEVELFAQRVSGSAAGPSAYRLQWVGHDPDGSVDHYLYAFGAPTADPRVATWTLTREREHALSFPARTAAPARASVAAIEPSVFRVRSVDGLGAMSAPAAVAFFDGALAPQVEITSPQPSSFVRLDLPSTFCVEWKGTAFDEDSSAERVAEYKYKLLTSTTEVDVATARTNPDSVRRYYAAHDWAGWTSARGRVTHAVLRDLTPGQEYVFAITCFDDDGNYDPIFSFDKNMLDFRATSSTGGTPTITLYNGSIHYQFGPNAFPATDVNLEVPAGQRITFNWFATPSSPGRQITGYRWGLDLLPGNDDDGDDDARADRERHDRHPRRPHDDGWSLSNTSATIGPFAGNSIHKLYVAAREGTGCGAGGAGISLLTVNLAVVQATFVRPLLIVNDTRLPLDHVTPGTDCTNAANRPIGLWPTAAELDTFLFAHGGVPWRCYPQPQLSSPGIFNGYPFDTIGTRIGIADLTIRLDLLGRYQHVIWLTDAPGALNSQPGSSPDAPQTSMRYMNSVSTTNTLAAYAGQGGTVWLAGGGAATASLINFNNQNNDNTLPIPRTLTFSFGNGELVPGRFIYDEAHWRSELKQFRVNGGRIRRYLGRFEGQPGTYASLPAEIDLKTPATDPFPPNRAGQPQSNFYETQFDGEFLSAPNEILEGAGPGAVSTLDSLYKMTASTLQPDTGRAAVQSVVMTYYHGAGNAPFILTGFNLWNFQRAQCAALVDFVLQELWGMPPPLLAAAPASTVPAGSRPLGRQARPRQEPGATSVAAGAARRN